METMTFNKLFCNYNTVGTICEYEHELLIIKETIAKLEEAVCSKQPFDKESEEHTYFEFAEAIVANAKAAYDNMVIGHIDVTNMLNRKIIEQYVSLKILINNPGKQLCDYWKVHSFYKGVHTYSGQYEVRLIKMLDEMYERLNIEEDFYKNSKGKAPIEKNYGWIYPLTKNHPSFKRLCELAEEPNYEDFSFMSEFVHGTNMLFINRKSVFDSSILNTLSILVFFIRQFTMLYLGYLDGEEILEKIEEFGELCGSFIPDNLD